MSRKLNCCIRTVLTSRKNEEVPEFMTVYRLKNNSCNVPNEDVSVLKGKLRKISLIANKNSRLAAIQEKDNENGKEKAKVKSENNNRSTGNFWFER